MNVTTKENCSMQGSSSYEDARERWQQGINALIERTAEAHLSKNLQWHLGRVLGRHVIQWLQIGGSKPVLDCEPVKTWLLSDECTDGMGQDVDFSAYGDVQKECVQATQNRYREMVQRL